jgi:serine protease Do
MQEGYMGPEPQAQDTAVIDEEPIKRRRTGVVWIAALVVIALLVGSLAVIQAALRGRSRSEVVLAPAATRDVSSAPSPTELSNSFREIAKAVKPAVVNINVVSVVSSPSGSLFQDFFGEGGPQSRPQKRPSTGSGFIVTQDGYILTNDHVVGNAEQIEVILADNRKLKAKVVGLDQESDLAVIKVEATGLPTVVLGNSDLVEQGDWVLALGSPFGLTQTLTAGIVSATGREVQGAPQYSKFIQTDASINPGNSGGPLVSMQREVIGINTMIVSNPMGPGGNVGIGFAISSNIARRVFEDLVRNGKVTRGYLGVLVGVLDAPTAKSLCMDPESGALVSEVSEDTPAARAGLRGGDVIISFDGKKVTAPRELTDAVAATEVGKSVSVEFMRDCQKQTVTIEVAERPSNIAARRNNQQEGPQGETPAATRLGIAAQTVTPELAAQGKLNSDSGALVRGVQPGSPAAEAGIRHGDVIRRLGRTDIRTADDLVQAEKALQSGEEVAVKIERGRQTLFPTVTIP